MAKTNLSEQAEDVQNAANHPEEDPAVAKEIATALDENTETTSSVAPQRSKKRRRRTKKGKPEPDRPAKRQHKEDDAPSMPFPFLRLPGGE